MDFLVRLSIAAVLVAALASATGAIYLHRWAAMPLPVVDATLIELKAGEAFSVVAARLQRDGVVNSDRLLTAWARLEGQTNRIQAGEYRVAEGESAAQLLDDLVAGAAVAYQVRLPEGVTIATILQQLSTVSKLVDDIGDARADTLLQQLGLGHGSAEGRLFPDTYHYAAGAPASDILRRAHQRLSEVLDAEWSLRADGLPYDSADDALIMASIIEKETGREVERANISRVFVTRLTRAMRLQTDPSVIFGLGAAFDGNLTRAHLATDNPYNTYTRRGLPPTPIALVSRASIHAALHPADNDYLFFVARGDGSSEFSSTLSQHTAAVRRYQIKDGHDAR